MQENRFEIYSNQLKIYGLKRGYIIQNTLYITIPCKIQRNNIVGHNYILHNMKTLQGVHELRQLVFVFL